MEKILIRSRIHDYSVIFTDEIGEILSEFGEHTFYIIDKNVYMLYKEKLSLPKGRLFWLVNPVEEEKNIDTVLKIVSFLEENKVHKDWKVVCFGGGITQDITAFLCDIYLRNLKWYFFPTTLLAMTDSCIGGKCGINYGRYKNRLGVFYPPEKVVIDTGFLGTLSEADWINGWGELLKFSLTEDEKFYQKLSNEKDYISCKNIRDYIYAGLIVKKHVIEEDELEGGFRRVLNYGHTFGHALEAYTHYEIPHGEAVIWGIDVANYIAVRQGMLPENVYLEIKGLIRRAFLQKEIEIKDGQKLMEIMKTDKKVRGSRIYFAMLTGLSHLEICPMELDGHLNSLFDDYLEENHAYYCH